MKTYILLGLALFCVNLSLAQTGRNGAEVFIQLDDRGPFTVYLNDEFVGSSSGKFRFYDVYGASAMLSIQQGNKKLYSGRINVRPNERLILNYGVRQGIRTLKTLAIYRNGQYALDDFDNYPDAYNTGIVPPRQNVNDRQNIFDKLLTMVKNEPFDENKIKVVQAYATNYRLSTAQIALLLQQFSRDDNKLVLVKAMSSSIVDPQNLYTLKDSFSFLSTKEEFLNYINVTSSPNRRLLSRGDFDQLLLNVKKEAFDDEKSKLIQAAVQYGAPSTAQVAELVKTYSFDDKALNMAKLVYPLVADPQRYFTLKDSFKFVSNKDAFLDFLARQ